MHYSRCMFPVCMVVVFYTTLSLLGRADAQSECTTFEPENITELKIQLEELRQEEAQTQELANNVSTTLTALKEHQLELLANISRYNEEFTAEYLAIESDILAEANRTNMTAAEVALLEEELDLFWLNHTAELALLEADLAILEGNITSLNAEVVDLNTTTAETEANLPVLISEQEELESILVELETAMDAQREFYVNSSVASCSMNHNCTVCTDGLVSLQCVDGYMANHELEDCVEWGDLVPAIFRGFEIDIRRPAQVVTIQAANATSVCCIDEDSVYGCVTV
uniref:Uncharacterized protein n=1 Tax=Palpitomonas bilix TaxID=652834 RepID=A0A7S3D6X4_9EUKA|mmetsp:Transcript_23926/g.60541  ORF Transcript_23926/g.60541 Transcript_23926/m.60541 type:complete len:284 (+) Transcript_23926:254-1105(+)|eukprot:CAMPEP_0113876074 /NCGR_PEP_ID=MMETSP0780_2-20120614/5286_1 /TAXON_ID=652834 /ORGANISM="Palpitomonas bilix" /LENGTH=283 /DNA_ID=CAMNT_0000862115 /DNA_START=262 /DNA_END=1113 /DNA_ORIENTATION=+ /assembly_acc=CAM_ASM_000599